MFKIFKWLFSFFGPKKDDLKEKIENLKKVNSKFNDECCKDLKEDLEKIFNVEDDLVKNNPKKKTSFKSSIKKPVKTKHVNASDIDSELGKKYGKVKKRLQNRPLRKESN